MKNLIAKLRSWVRTDGLLHGLVSALLTVALGWIRPLWIAVVIVFGIGVGKELYDKATPEKNTAEWHDLICDVAGIIVGLFLVGLNIMAR